MTIVNGARLRIFRVRGKKRAASLALSLASLHLWSVENGGGAEDQSFSSGFIVHRSQLAAFLRGFKPLLFIPAIMIQRLHDPTVRSCDASFGR
jgi:hypothetical protein